MLLPDVIDDRANIVRTFQKDFNLARSLVDLGIRELELICKAKTPRIKAISKGVALSILAREIRRYASIIELSSLGLLENVDVLSRSLFEGLMAERFVFSRPKHWSKCSKPLRQSRKTLPPIPRRFDAIEFRSWLYAHYEGVRVCSVSRSIRQDDGVATISDEQSRIFEDNAMEAEKTIGSRWTKVQRDTRSYSGLRVDQLAEHVGLEGAHRTFYPLHCIKSHAVDAMTYWHLSGDNQITIKLVDDISELKELPRTLHFASLHLILLLNDLGDVFSLKLENSIMKLLRKIRPLKP